MVSAISAVLLLTWLALFAVFLALGGDPEVTDFEPPSRLAIHGQIGPFQATAAYLLEPVAGGTRLTNHVELEPSSALLRLVGPLAVPSVKAAVARNLTALKELLEGTRPA